MFGGRSNATFALHVKDAVCCILWTYKALLKNHCAHDFAVFSWGEIAQAQFHVVTKGRGVVFGFREFRNAPGVHGVNYFFDAGPVGGIGQVLGFASWLPDCFVGFEIRSTSNFPL